MKEKYSIEEILNDDKLLLDLKSDVIFKNCFLDINNKGYIGLLISKLFDLDYKELKEFFIIKNSELPSKRINKKSSYADLICSYRNIDFIIEMNYKNDNDIYEKNINYLFKQHTGKISKSNRYGKNMYTYLINIDNYDFLNKNQLIYDAGLNYTKYKMNKYKNIKVLNINLAYLRSKLYNKDELNDIEKLLLIFVSQRKDVIREHVNLKEVEGVIEIMEKMKYENDYIATYNREEFELYLKERDEEQRRIDEKKRQEDEKRREDFNNEKKSIIQEFIKLGLSVKRISELTKLPIEQIKTLL